MREVWTGEGAHQEDNHKPSHCQQHTKRLKAATGNEDSDTMLHYIALIVSNIFES